MPFISTPSRHSGYARSRSECEYPHLWPLVGWSPALQQQGGQVVKDAGLQYPGTMSNMEVADWETIKGYRALTFGGTNEYVGTTNAKLLAKFASGKFCTMAGWFYSATTANVTSLGFAGTSQRNRFLIQNEPATPKLYFILEDGAYRANTLATEFTGWNHFAMVFDGTKSTNATRLIGFRNGVQLSLTTEGVTIPSSLSSSYQSFDVARDYYDVMRYFTSSVGDCLLYDRPLREKDISQLYHLGPGGWATLRRRRISMVPAAAAPQNNAAWWLAYQMGM